MIRGVLMPGGSVPLPGASVLLDQSKKPHDLNVISSYLARFVSSSLPSQAAGSLRRAIGDVRSDVRLTGELPACFPMGQVMGPSMPTCTQPRGPVISEISISALLI